MDLGVGVVREAIRWPQVDLGGGRYDWSSVKAAQDAATDCKITPIWDLCHYGLPDGCDPFSAECRERFADYCRAAAEFVTGTAEPPYFFTPINEITFFSAAATDLEWMYPFAKGREDELKRALAHMAIAGARAIREVEPGARMVHVDPIVHAVPPADRPDLADEALEEEHRKAVEGWDMLAGRVAPELGGSPEILDIVGVNVYHYSQVQLDADKKREILGPRDPRRKPLSELLQFAWDRYRRPLIIGETSGYQEHRAEWLRMTMEECCKALNAGVDLHGVCLYPFVDVPDWWTQQVGEDRHLRRRRQGGASSGSRATPISTSCAAGRRCSTSPRTSSLTATGTAGAGSSSPRSAAMPPNGPAERRCAATRSTPEASASSRGSARVLIPVLGQEQPALPLELFAQRLVDMAAAVRADR